VIYFEPVVLGQRREKKMSVEKRMNAF
jgi:hypothetical protein